MPELPEVEVLVRHLAPILKGKVIHGVLVRRARVLRPTSTRRFKGALQGARFVSLSRRGKYLLFLLRTAEGKELAVLGHLGMTGRMYLMAAEAPLPKHAAVVLNLGSEKFVFEDTRYFGRFTLDAEAVKRLGPEPLTEDFSVQFLAEGLKHSSQSAKIKLLDQTLAAGVGNIYASEALFRAGVSPLAPARELTRAQVRKLRRAIRDVLTEAIKRGSTLPLNYAGNGKRDGFFYVGRSPGAEELFEERLQVYDRAGKPCLRCGQSIVRMVQGARSTFYCPDCQAVR
jgi:formamidopyrimidine-DNA glycosylase